MLPLRGDGVLGDGVGLVASAVSSWSPTRHSQAGFFASSVVSCPCPESWDAQRGCIGQFVRIRPAQKTRHFGSHLQLDRVRRPASRPEHSTHATALIRHYSSRTQNFSGRECVPAAYKARVCSQMLEGRAARPYGPASGRRLDRALSASSAAHLPGRRRVGSAPRADRFSDSVRPRSAPG